MKTLFAVILAFSFIQDGHALYLQHCYSHGDGVSYSFESCINRNFREIDRKLNTFSSYCSNFSRDEVSFSFTSCIERNFRTADRELDTFLSYCSNFDRNRLSFSYVNCVNRNFNTIEREIRNRDNN